MALQLKSRHRLLCGDSTSQEQVERLMDGEKADMVFTDPPYNIASHSRNYIANTSQSMKALKNSEWDKNFNPDNTLDRIKENVKSNCTIYVWTSHFLIQKIFDHFNQWCDFVGYNVWSKTNPTPSMSKRHWSWNTELCVYATLGTDRVVNFPEHGNALSTWSFAKTHHTQFEGHTAQKPIDLCVHPIIFSSNENQLILDLFLGSGSTLIACEKTNRRCYGMEIDPHYCDVIVERYRKFCGKLIVKETR